MEGGSPFFSALICNCFVFIAMIIIMREYYFPRVYVTI